MASCDDVPAASPLSYAKLSLAIGVGIGLIAPLFDIVVQTAVFFLKYAVASALYGPG